MGVLGWGRWAALSCSRWNPESRPFQQLHFATLPNSLLGRALGGNPSVAVWSTVMHLYIYSDVMSSDVMSKQCSVWQKVAVVGALDGIACAILYWRKTHLVTWRLMCA